MPNPIDLDHIDRLLTEATPGRCVLWSDDPSHGRLVAALVTAAPAMVAEIRRLRAEATQLVPRATEAELQAMTDQITEVIDRERARAREEGRAEERAVIAAWLLDEGEAFLSEDIERGKHREEDDNA